MAIQKENSTYEISWNSLFKILAVILVVYAIFYLSSVIMVLFTVIILTVSLSPIVDKMKKKLHLPRILAISILFILIIAFVFLTVYTIVPPVATELKNLYQILPDYGKKFLPFLKSINTYNAPSNITQLTNGGVANNIISTVGEFFGSVLDFVLILVLTFILLIEENGFVKYIISLIPVNDKVYAIEIGKKISNKIGSWFAGQILIMLIIGVVNALAMWAVGIPYALVLGILAFIFESVPNIGPIAAAIPAIILAYIDAPWKAVYVLIFTLVLHQLSNQFLVPKVMGKILNISAFVIILGLILGGELAGITGMILALPVVAAIQVMAQEWPNIKKRIPKNEIKDLRD